MRVLHVTHQYAPAIGGAEQHIVQLSEEFAARGHTVEVFTSRSIDYRSWANTLPAADVLNGVRIRRFRSIPRRGSTWRLLDVGLSNHMNGPAWLWEPMVWYGNGPVMPGLGAAIRRRARDFDLVHINQLHYAHAWLAFRAARASGLPIVLSPLLHAEQPATYDVGYMRSLLRSSDAVVALTQAEQAFIRTAGLSKRAVVGGSGLRMSDFPPLEQAAVRTRFGLPQDAFVVLFLGRKTGYKGLDLVLQAVRRLQQTRGNVYLLAVGAETEESARLWAEQSDVANLVVRGAVADEERLAALAASDVLAMPSSGESFGIVYLEAWAYAKPVIGARIKAVSSLVDEGEDGFLVDVGGAAELTARLAELADSPALAREMGERGRRKLLDRYTTTRVGDTMENLYRRVIRHHGRG